MSVERGNRTAEDLQYLMEGAGLGFFMMSACGFAALLEHPSSPIHHAIGEPVLRRVAMGLAMGATAIGIIYSPWGQQSGAHLNPAVTLTFFRLGKVERWDALFYSLSHFAGGLAGVLVMALGLGSLLSEPPINYAVTVPGAGGENVAFLTELLISFFLMGVVLCASNSSRLAPYTGLFAGALLVANITLTAPLSGTSMNPARTLSSALPARLWTGLWIYFTAPPVGMLLAAQVYLWLKGREAVSCAKLHHQNRKRCIFCAFHVTRSKETHPSR